MQFHPKYPTQIILKETKHWFISLWENQYYLGRASIGLKDKSLHHLAALSDEQSIELFELIKWYETALTRTFNTTHFNWTSLMNNSYKPKNIDNPENFHLHVWPRYSKEVKIGNEVFKDEVFGHHYDKYKEKYVKKEVYQEIAQKILKSL